MKSLPEIKADNARAARETHRRGCPARTAKGARCSCTPIPETLALRPVQVDAADRVVRTERKALSRTTYRHPDADALAILLRESADAVEAACQLRGASPALHSAHPRLREAAGRLELAAEVLNAQGKHRGAVGKLVGEILNGDLARRGGK